MPLGTHGVAETVLPDTRTGMEGHAVADQGMGNGGTRADIAIAPHEHAIADDGTGGDRSAGADPRLAADDGAWLNDYPFGDLGGGMDEHSIRPRCRCRCSRLKGIGVKQPNGHGEGAMGYVRRDRGRPSRHETSVAALDEAGGGLCCRQLTGIFAA